MTEVEFSNWLEDPEAVRCVLIEVGVLTGGSEVTRYLSNLGYTTKPTDNPPNVTYIPCVSGGVSVSESLPLNGKASLSWGDIEVANFGGDKDGWLDDIWSGREVSVYLGDVRWDRGQFRKVFSGIVEDIGARNVDTLNLLLRDLSQKLNTPATEALLENNSLKKDVLKPLCFGEVHNISPVLIDESTLTYMVHDGPIESIIEVRDNGIPVDYGVNLSLGTFSLSASPVGTITASVQGAKFSGQYRNTVGPLIVGMATTYGKFPLQASQVDSLQIDAFSANHPQVVGLYLHSRTNLLDALQQVAASVGAQVMFTPEGKLQIGKISDPSTLATTAVGKSEMLQNSLSVASTPAVRAAVKIGYCRNYTEQKGLTTGLPAQHAELYGTEWLVVQVANQSVADLRRMDTAPEQEDTLLQTQQDADAEAARRLALWSVRRLVLRYDSFGRATLLKLGGGVRITHPRFGLSSGKPAQVISKKTDWLSQKVTFEVLV